jgi:hypothetical protein
VPQNWAQRKGGRILFRANWDGYVGSRIDGRFKAFGLAGWRLGD